ncbi:MAG TPA: TetR/AcrR family transcriptional regulator [Jatrophihabitans sp.]|jgi:AcrR family transcriptional regulator|nr:TetR/AcrR family transcriptional regulator [Jatrophihabitans sp.]
MAEARTKPDVGRREILDAAAAEFARSGYGATTIDAIAERMGATKGRVYHYYRAKSEIFADIVSAGMRELIDQIAPIAASEDVSSLDRLWRMAHHHAALMMTRNSYQRVAIQSVEMVRQHGAAAWLADTIALRDAYEQLFADAIADGIADGYLRDVDPRQATKPVLGALNWITVWYDPERDSADGTAAINRVADMYADFVVNGLRRMRS